MSQDLILKDIVTDVHHVRNMTAEEKTAKQDEAKAIWAENGYASHIQKMENFISGTKKQPLGWR